MTADTGGFSGLVHSSSAAALSVLVLGGAPIVRAGIAYLLRREFVGAVHIATAEWSAREHVLEEIGGELDLVVAWADSDMPPEACWRFGAGLAGVGVIVVVPPAASAASHATACNTVVSIPIGASLSLWRKALQVASRRRPRFAARRYAAVTQAPVALLTGRQREVLEMLSMGLSNKHIASRLSLSVGTVKLHVAAVLRAMQAKNRMNLVLRRAAELNVHRAGDDGLV